MRRGGQHVFIDWLLEQTQGSALFLNDVAPGQDLEQRALNMGEFDKCFYDGKAILVKPDNIDVVIVNYEDWLLNESVIHSTVGSNITADQVVNILLLRDPLNLFASRYFFWARMPLDAERWKWNDKALWLNHAEHYLANVSPVSTSQLISVNFDVWSSEINIRRSLSQLLSLNFSDQALQRISHVGSQFDTTLGKNYSKRVNSRWQFAAEIPQYKNLFNDEFTTVSQQIFANNENVAAMHQIQPTLPPDAGSVFSSFKAGEVKQAQYNAIRLCHDAPVLNNWGLLAGIHAQQGNYSDVIACCRKMLALDAGNISTKYNLALALQELSRFDEASLIYEEVLSASSFHAGTMINLANIYIKTGAFVKARKLLVNLQASGNSTFELYNTLGLLAMEEKDYIDAIEQFNKAITINSGSIASYLNLSKCLAKTGEADKAETMLNSLIQKNQLDDHSVQLALAFIYREMGEYDKALQLLLDEKNKERVSIDLFIDMGLVYREIDDYEKSIQAYQQALTINHAFERTLNNIGAVNMLQCDYSSAEQFFCQSISVNPEYAEAHWNLAWVSLLLGDFEQGWQEYEWRFSMGVAEKLQSNDAQEWKGENIQGKKILLYVEQGYGDAIQFVRYSKLVSDTGAEVFILCDQVIAGLLDCVDGVETVTSFEKQKVDYYAPLLSVPHIMQLDVIPFTKPYINPDYKTISNDLVDMLAAIDQEKLHIGITWCGNPAFPDNGRRSCGIERFAELAERNDIVLYSLQKGDASKKINKYNMICNIINMDSMITNFTDTAYIMSKMDLIITVDTSVAHLSGAIGCKTWVLLAYSADWRWHNDVDSRWYQSSKLFKQTAPGNWSEVFSRIGKLLDTL